MAPNSISTQAPSKLPVTTGTSRKPNTLAPQTSSTVAPVTTSQTMSTQAPSKIPQSTVTFIKPDTLDPSPSTTEVPTSKSTLAPVYNQG